MRLADFIAAGAALAGGAGRAAGIRAARRQLDCLGCHGTELYMPPRKGQVVLGVEKGNREVE
jgi:hypothetical protein